MHMKRNIKFPCDHCESRLVVDIMEAGEGVICGHCGEITRVPMVDDLPVNEQCAKMLGLSVCSPVRGLLYFICVLIIVSMLEKLFDFPHMSEQSNHKTVKELIK